MKNYILASNKNWHIKFFMEKRALLPGNWSIVTCNSDLEEQVDRLTPRYVFFPHWSDMVTSEIYMSTECVCFHMTDVPYGRGGSPLQNLIVRGHTETKVSALRMTKDLDSGPVYFKRGISLSGSAMDIYERLVPICFEMIKKIVLEEIKPTDQVGVATKFKRRLPEESDIDQIKSIENLYDHIRMLDAPDYPPAFLLHNGMKIEFTHADLTSKAELKAVVRVKKYDK